MRNSGREAVVSAASRGEVTRLLESWRRGDDQALDRLIPLVYPELRRLAARYLRGERRDHTLEATALVHEAYLRLAGGTTPEWRDRVHFYAVSSRLMRRILVDHARARLAGKRGGGLHRAALDLPELVAHDRAAELVALDDALAALAAFDRRKARVLELRFFGGLSVEEAAAVLGLSTSTVVFETRLARAWLRREMGRPPESDDSDRREAG
jgi:RNA polymerase sigma factor (TIGR02999 family)